MTQTVEQKNVKLNGYLLIHRAIERNLQLLEQHSREQAQPSIEKAAKILAWWKMVWGIIEQHHLMEDNLTFPTYFERDPDLRSLMESLTADHHVLDDLVIQIEGFLKLAAQPNPNRQAAYNQYLETLARFNTLMQAHLNREEGIVLKTEERLFTPEEVEALTQKVMKSTPIKTLAVELPFIFSGADLAIEKQFQEVVPVFIKLLYKYSWRKNFLKRLAGFMAA